MPGKNDLHDETLIRHNANVVAVDVTQEAILLDVDSGYFFQLNSTAASIWHLLEEPRSLADLCRALQSDFPAGDAALVDDVRGFVGDLVERGILELA